MKSTNYKQILNDFKQLSYIDLLQVYASTLNEYTDLIQNISISTGFGKPMVNKSQKARALSCMLDKMAFIFRKKSLEHRKTTISIKHG